VSLDDLMQVNATVCTQAAADSLFPVKVLFIVDTSNSMIATDVMGYRSSAVLNAMQRFSGNPAVLFGVIAFDSRIESPTDNVFTTTPDVGRVSSRLSTADRLTDYQGALSAAYTMLSLDMQAASPAVRARTKYVVIFFTDGVPDPQCSATMDDTFSAGVCEVPREMWDSAFTVPIDPSLYAGLQAGQDYNQPEQIYGVVDDILKLQDVYRVAEVRLHSALLFPLSAVNDPLSDVKAFNLNRPKAVALLKGVAEHGQGTFTEFDDPRSISFLNFNYTSVKEPNAIADFFVTNQNSIFSSEALNPDTDGDGLDDATEFALIPALGSGKAAPIRATRTATITATSSRITSAKQVSIRKIRTSRCSRAAPAATLMAMACATVKSSFSAPTNASSIRTATASPIFRSSALVSTPWMCMTQSATPTTTACATSTRSACT